MSAADTHINMCWKKKNGEREGEPGHSEGIVTLTKFLPPPS